MSKNHSSKSDVKNFWLYKKHINHIEVTDLTYITLRKAILQNTSFTATGKDSLSNTMFNWSMVSPSYHFMFDYEECEKEIAEMLAMSEVMNSKHVFVETTSDIPIFKVRTQYFVEHWDDFVRANNGMGSIVASNNFNYIMEFTDDAEYLVFSNFKIWDKY